MTGSATYDITLHQRRLGFRRPAPEDLDAVFTIHGDPRTNVHNPGWARR